MKGSEQSENNSLPIFTAAVGIFGILYTLHNGNRPFRRHRRFGK